MWQFQRPSRMLARWAQMQGVPSHLAIRAAYEAAFPWSTHAPFGIPSPRAALQGISTTLTTAASGNMNIIITDVKSGQTWSYDGAEIERYLAYQNEIDRIEREIKTASVPWDPERSKNANERLNKVMVELIGYSGQTSTSSKSQPVSVSGRSVEGSDFSSRTHSQEYSGSAFGSGKKTRVDNYGIISASQYARNSGDNYGIVLGSVKPGSVKSGSNNGVKSASTKSGSNHGIKPGSVKSRNVESGSRVSGGGSMPPPTTKVGTKNSVVRSATPPPASKASTKAPGSKSLPPPSKIDAKGSRVEPSKPPSSAKVGSAGSRNPTNPVQGTAVSGNSGTKKSKRSISLSNSKRTWRNRMGLMARTIVEGMGTQTGFEHYMSYMYDDKSSDNKTSTNGAGS